MTTACIGLLNGRGLGDTLGMMSQDVGVRQRAEEPYWVIHARGIWIHFPLFHLYHKAGIFRNLIYIDGVDGGNYANPSRLSEYLDHIEMLFGNRHDAIHVLASKPEYMPQELRERFRFLASTGGYMTLQPSSVHTSVPDPKNFVGCKRISYQKVRTALARLCPRGGAVIILGSRWDAPVNALYFQTLNRDFPEIRLTDLTGKTTVEEMFRILYNAEAHLCCESGSAFFTAQLGVPTIQVYNREESRRNFADYFAAIPTLETVLENRNVFQDYSDLEEE